MRMSSPPRSWRRSRRFSRSRGFAYTKRQMPVHKNSFIVYSHAVTAQPPRKLPHTRRRRSSPGFQPYSSLYRFSLLRRVFWNRYSPFRDVKETNTHAVVPLRLTLPPSPPPLPAGMVSETPPPPSSPSFLLRRKSKYVFIVA